MKKAETTRNTQEEPAPKNTAKNSKKNCKYKDKGPEQTTKTNQHQVLNAKEKIEIPVKNLIIPATSAVSSRLQSSDGEPSEALASQLKKKTILDSKFPNQMQRHTYINLETRDRPVCFKEEIEMLQVLEAQTLNEDKQDSRCGDPSGRTQNHLDRSISDLKCSECLAFVKEIVCTAETAISGTPGARKRLISRRLPNQLI